MTALEVLPGGGQRSPVTACGICGVPHNRPCGIMAAYQQYLRLAGFTAKSITERRRTVLRLAAALPVPVLEADPAMLAAWRTSLTITGKAIGNYTRQVCDFCAWAAAEGHRDGGDPAAALRLPPGKRTADCTLCGVPSWEECPVLASHKEWMRQRGYSANTIYGRERFLARLGAALAPVPVLDAGEKMLARWRGELRISDEAVVHYVCDARSFYDWAIGEGLREGNPAARIPIPRTGRRLPRPIPESDLMAALQLAPPRIRPWLVLGGWCGARACEIALLRRSCILDQAVPPVIVIAAGATKGHAPERVLPMSAFVLAEMQAADLPASGFAFRRLDGRPGHIAPWRISQLVNTHLHDCNIPATLHQLRHRYLTEIYRNSLDLRLTQELAGHSSPATTAGYAKFANASAVKAVEALGVPGRLHAVKEARLAGHAGSRTTAGYAGKGEA